MIPERITRYLNAAVNHPHRTAVALLSELTRVPINVSFYLNGDEQPIKGKLPDAISRYMYLLEGIRSYEPETQIMMNSIIDGGSTVLIAGAHIGVHAIAAKQLVGKEGKVIGFEPTPDTFKLFKENCHTRGIITESLAIAEHGVNEITLTVFDTRHSAWNSGVGARSNKANRWNPRPVRVPATSIDDYCLSDNISPDNLILDLENGEMGALLGGEEIINNRKPNIIIECGDLGRENCNSTNACLSLLKRWGYNFFEVDMSTGSFTTHEIMSSYPDDYPNVLAIANT